MVFKRTWLLLIACLVFCSCEDRSEADSKETEDDMLKIGITSTAFEQGGMIPEKYTCDGMDISPPLAWKSLPDDAKSLALICEDPDAPAGTWVHWVLYNLSPEIRKLTEHLPIDKTLANGAMQGTNDFGKTGYGGPCPPGGTHRYYFKLYALDTDPGVEPGITKAQLLEAIKGHVLAEGQLMGKYKR